MKKIYFYFVKVLYKLNAVRQKFIEIKKIKEKKRVFIQNKVSLTNEQKEQVNKFYLKHYGKKIMLNWHKNYYAISGKFDYKYFPESLYIPYFERLLNNPNYYKCLQDKNVTELFIKGLDYVKSIDYYAKCVNGLLTNDKGEIIDINQLSRILEGERCFIKSTVDSNSGKGCRVCHFINNKDQKTNENIVDIIKTFGNNYVIQHLVKNSSFLSKLNPTSLNTFRVITYILDNKVYHMPVLLRIGRYGKFLDNAHAGGIFIGIDDNGDLLEFAHSEFGGNYDRHPDTDVVFKGYCIPEVTSVIDVAHKLQTLFPQVGCINWDLTLDENNDVVLIETNMRCGSVWLPQMAHGKSAFGDNTERVLEIIRNNKELY